MIRFFGFLQTKEKGKRLNEFEVNLEVHLSFTYSEYPFTNKYNEGGEKEDDPEDCNDLYVLKCGRWTSDYYSPFVSPPVCPPPLPCDR